MQHALKRALVAQGIEHRPPEPGAQVRILPRAPGQAIISSVAMLIAPCSWGKKQLPPSSGGESMTSRRLAGGRGRFAGGGRSGGRDGGTPPRPPHAHIPTGEVIPQQKRC